jgi:uncharacterized membrane protein YeiB
MYFDLFALSMTVLFLMIFAFILGMGYEMFCTYREQRKYERGAYRLTRTRNGNRYTGKYRR